MGLVEIWLTKQKQKQKKTFKFFFLATLKTFLWKPLDLLQKVNGLSGQRLFIRPYQH